MEGHRGGLYAEEKEIGLGCKVIYGIEYCDKTLPGIYFPAVCSHERKFRQKSGRSVVHGVKACGMRLKGEYSGKRHYS